MQPDPFIICQRDFSSEDKPADIVQGTASVSLGNDTNRIRI